MNLSVGISIMFVLLITLVPIMSALAFLYYLFNYNKILYNRVKNFWGKWFWVSGFNISEKKELKKIFGFILFILTSTLAITLILTLTLIFSGAILFNLSPSNNTLLLALSFVGGGLITIPLCFFYWYKKIIPLHKKASAQEEQDLLIKLRIEVVPDLYNYFNEIIESIFVIKFATKRLDKKMLKLKTERKIRLRILFYLRHMETVLQGYSSVEIQINERSVNIDFDAIKELIAFHAQTVYETNCNKLKNKM